MNATEPLLPAHQPHQPHLPRAGQVVWRDWLSQRLRLHQPRRGQAAGLGASRGAAAQHARQGALHRTHADNALCGQHCPRAASDTEHFWGQNGTAFAGEYSVCPLIIRGRVVQGAVVAFVVISACRQAENTPRGKCQNIGHQIETPADNIGHINSTDSSSSSLAAPLPPSLGCFRASQGRLLPSSVLRLQPIRHLPTAKPRSKRR